MPISVGKSSLVMANQVKWKHKKYYALFMYSADKTTPRSWLWVQAKFQLADSAPFSTLVQSLLVCTNPRKLTSMQIAAVSALRQLVSTPVDAYCFVRMLSERLGPQITNLLLPYTGSPAVKAALEAWGINSIALEDGSESSTDRVSSGESKELTRLATSELSARFQNLVVSILGIITEKTPCTISG